MMWFGVNVTSHPDISSEPPARGRERKSGSGQPALFISLTMHLPPAIAISDRHQGLVVG